MHDVRILKPHQRAFFQAKLLWSVVNLFLPVFLLFFFFSPLFDLSFISAAGLGLTALTLLLLIRILQLRVKFRKTNYELHEDRLVVITGGRFTDRSITLRYRNVTQVKMRRSYLEKRLYGTGTITIKAAGSDVHEAVFESIEEPHEVYAQLNDALKSDGFSMTRRNCVQEEKPGLLASLLELARPGALALVGIYWFSANILGFYMQALGSNTPADLLNFARTGSEQYVDPELAANLASWQFSLQVFFVLFLLGIIASLVVAGLSLIGLTRRTYTLYNDVIEYEEGYLNEVQSFIPLENLANVEVTQWFLSRFFGYSNVVLSGHGKKSEIRFNSMHEGPRFKENLENQIRIFAEVYAETRLLTINISELDNVGGGSASTRYSLSANGVTDAAGAATGLLEPLEFKASKMKACVAMSAFLACLSVGFLLLALFSHYTLSLLFGGYSPLFFVIVMTLVIGSRFTKKGAVMIPFRDVIHAFAVRYRVDKKRVSHHYKLFSTKSAEFSNEKLTAVVFTESLIDKILGTATVSFRSIGAEEPIEFKHIPNGRAAAQEILLSLGFNEPMAKEWVGAVYSPKSLFLSGNATVIFLTIMTIVAPILALTVDFRFLILLASAFFGVGALLAYFDHYYRRCGIEYYSEYMCFRRGIFLRTEQYARYSKIKSTGVTRYFRSEDGELSWVVGGGEKCSMAFVENAWDRHIELDARVEHSQYVAQSEAEQFDTTHIKLATRRVASAVVRAVVSSIKYFPILVLLPLRIPFAIASARRVKYVIETHRLVVEWGVFLRSRRTVLKSRIDHLTTNRDAINKMFNNGNIGVRTLGSGGTDLSFDDVSDEQKFVREIELWMQQNPEQSVNNKHDAPRGIYLPDADQVGL